MSIVFISCGYEGDTIIYKKDENTGEWKVWHEAKMSKSTNSVSWAPIEYGLILAVACQDEAIYILRHSEGKWSQSSISTVHSLGVKAVSFAPGNSPSSLFQKDKDSETTKMLRLVSGGDEVDVRIWSWDMKAENKWEQEDVLKFHTDWIRDVAWAPNIGLPEEQIATCSTDRSVIIWSRSLSDNDNDEPSQNKWKPTPLPHNFEDVISHVSWSLTGGVLACSGGVNHVSLWKQDLSGQWQKINDLSQESGNNNKKQTTGENTGEAQPLRTSMT